MNKVHVKGSTEYDVLIEEGLLADVGVILHEIIDSRRALVVTDENVAGYYLEEVVESLTEAGFDVAREIIPSGEQNKSVEQYAKLLDRLLEEDFERSDVAIALGGGMIGDLVGFTAATYKRGMHFVQIPTSLLAAVDASVGGKNAINLPLGKNQVGTIRNPDVVICDPNCIETLTSTGLHDGYAEIIKYGVLNGHEIIDALREEDFTKVIALSVETKRDVVEMDEADNSFRQYLNYGHLIGHAIEAASEYAISHGEAVAKGMAIEARCAALSGYIEMATYLEISDILEEFGFDLSCKYSSLELMPYVLRDKRIKNGMLQLIIPEHIGECNMLSVTEEKLKDFLMLI